MSNKTSLRCATLNLDNLGDWSHPNKLDNLIATLANDLSFPDIIAVQEIGQSLHQDSGGNQPVIAHISTSICERLNALPERPHYQYIDIPPLPNTTGGNEGFNIRCGFFYNQSITIEHVNIIGKNQPEFCGCEDLQYKASRYPLAICVAFQQKKIWLINCHLKSMNNQTNPEKKAARRQRNMQARAIKSFAEERTNDGPIIIMGDMNDTPNSETIRIIKSELDSLWNYEPRACYSYKYHGKPVVLDYIFFNKSVNLLDHRVYHTNTSKDSMTRFSDHDPLLIHLTL